MKRPEAHRREAAAACLERAESALRSARILLEEGMALDAISRAYYAALHAARAALACVGEAPKSHKGTHNRFWTRFVKEGQFPQSMGGFLSEAQEMRQSADYDAFTQFDTTAASDFLRDAEAFVSEARTLVKRLLEEGDSP